MPLPIRKISFTGALRNIHLLKLYPDQNISLCDGVLAILASQFELPVWTFDHHFDVMQAHVWR